MNRTAPSPRSGNLADSPLPQLLDELTAEGVTGTLALRHDQVVKAIYLQDGELVFATSTLKSDRLGEVLVRYGIIAPQAHRAVTLSIRETGKREGETLVEMGVLAPKALFDGLKLQVEEIIISAFQWDSGQYQFRSAALPSQVIPLPIHLEKVLPKALGRLGEG